MNPEIADAMLAAGIISEEQANRLRVEIAERLAEGLRPSPDASDIVVEHHDL